jgi:adenosylcobinamide-phosphate synthase
MTFLIIAIFLAFALDRWLPVRAGNAFWVWYSDWVESIEQRFNGGLRSQGIVAVILALAPVSTVVLLAYLVLGQISGVLAFVFSIAVLYLCIDLYRLSHVTLAVATALEQGDVKVASLKLREITGKDTVETTSAGVAHATVEAVLKQGNTLVMAPVFWFLVLGPFGAIWQRLVSVLDKAWGYRTARFSEFGWAAARLDDLVTWIPARVTALSYAMMGSFEDALHCWRRHAGMWSDLGSGPLLVTGLGALHLTSCEDSSDEDPYGMQPLSPAALPTSADVRRALALVWRVMLMWLAVGVLMAGANLAGFISRVI